MSGPSSRLNTRYCALAGAVVFVDLALLALFLVWASVEHYQIRTSPFFGTSLFSTQEGSLIENWGYLKEAAIALLCLVIAKRRQHWFYAAFAVLFVSVMLDDSLGLHERVGDWLEADVGLGKFGPLVSAGVVNGVPFMLVLASFVRLPPAERRLALPMLLGFFVLSFFAVGVDGVHGLLARGQGGETAWTLLEDGGELLSLSGILFITVWALRSPGEAATPAFGEDALTTRSVFFTAGGAALLYGAAVLFEIDLAFPLG